ncbi:MAG: bifunctional diaminohydroxyphosphoribosylaminopyrimidine deaminase/5-amino-6-(5-phosphoribosylamino)uracil reductase RibD [Nitrospirae bacterium]|nr:bifunctional diaminohydroxyphosphoribosylaminopyrimidine deaminase/5-amino-6-(5-phosphoribosylamino)uracil reductase RibD [Nitrospirota bacterium]
MSPDKTKTYMQMALRLAKKGMGITSPNPMVGAVVVKDGRVIGRGYHKGPGKGHAEAVAIRDAGPEAKGATLYINLEPCCHTDKRTPPCTQEIIRSQVRRVVIGMEDPNPMVNGRGIRELAGAGIQIEKGVLYPEAVRLNEIYSKFISTKTPFVILKSASSLDGRIALPSGESKWITGETARRYSHRLRAMVDAVLVGVGTILADDPLLSVRDIGIKGKQPLRIIVDSKLRIPLTAKVLDQRGGQETMIVTTKATSSEAVETLEKIGVKTLIAGSREDGEVSLRSLMGQLGKLGISSVLIEGGSKINASAFREGIVDKVVLFYSPRIIGGSDSIGMVGGKAPASLDESVFLRDIIIRRLGDDVLVEGYVKKVMSGE